MYPTGISLVMIQVNFKCGGMALGMYCCHRIIDGPTCIAFLRAWAETPQGSGTEVIPRFVPCNSLFPQNPSLPKDSTVLMWPSMFNQSKYVTRRFLFDASALNSLKAKVASSSFVPTRDWGTIRAHLEMRHFGFEIKIWFPKTIRFVTCCKSTKQILSTTVTICHGESPLECGCTKQSWYWDRVASLGEEFERCHIENRWRFCPSNTRGWRFFQGYWVSQRVTGIVFEWGGKLLLEIYEILDEWNRDFWRVSRGNWSRVRCIRMQHNQ